VVATAALPIENRPFCRWRHCFCNCQEGDDDMFSSDLSPDERDARLGHIASVPMAAFISGADEYMP
ncbi:unnamed protein product, partial [Scytosiphon promiscuus]